MWAVWLGVTRVVDMFIVKVIMDKGCGHGESEEVEMNKVTWLEEWVIGERMRC